jgi:predicted ester cyclase
VWALLFRVYPDIHLTVEDVIVEGNKVVARNTVTGTDQGEFVGVGPTGKSVTYNEIFVFRFADGRVVESWGVVDVYAQMKQIGVLGP